MVGGDLRRRSQTRSLSGDGRRRVDRHFEELRARLAALKGARKTAERELHALHRRTEDLAQLERDCDGLLESYADLVPEVIDALGSAERHRPYRIIGLEVHLASNGSFELSGDVMGFSKLEISSA